MDRLQDKVVVVTGGNSGIGLAAAHAFAREGARVTISGRDRDRLDAAARAVGAGTEAIRADVTDVGQIAALFDAVARSRGPIDAVFVNAGLARVALVEEVDEALFDTVMTTNVRGSFFTVQQALPHLAPTASIILCGSVAARTVYPGTSVYAASKAALHSLARSLTPELQARGVRINTLEVGYVDTPLYERSGVPEDVIEAARDQVASAIPAGGFGTPADLAGALVFLASDESAYMLGSELLIDGGLASRAVR